MTKIKIYQQQLLQTPENTVQLYQMFKCSNSSLEVLNFINFQGGKVPMILDLAPGLLSFLLLASLICFNWVEIFLCYPDESSSPC